MLLVAEGSSEGRTAQLQGHEICDEHVSSMARGEAHLRKSITPEQKYRILGTHRNDVHSYI